MKIVLDTTILVRAHEKSRGLTRLLEFYRLFEDRVYDYISYLRHSAELVSCSISFVVKS